MGTTGRQTKEKLNVGSPNFCIRGPFKNLSLDRSKLLVLNDQHLVVVAWQTLIGQFKTSHITRIPSFTAVSTVYDKKAFNILTLILVWSRGDHGRPAWNCNLSLFYFPTKHTQVYTVELATFLSDFLFNCFFFFNFSRVLNCLQIVWNAGFLTLVGKFTLFPTLLSWRNASNLYRLWTFSNQTTKFV